MTTLHYHKQTHHIRVEGGELITDFSRRLVRELAAEAHLHIVYVTSVERTVKDQARTFYDNYVATGNNFNYKNPEVPKIVAQARHMHREGKRRPEIEDYLFGAIEHVHGGPVAVSRHLGWHPLDEIFDIAHYHGKTNAPHRKNYMTPPQARAFLEACRKRMPDPITHLGHSAELGLKLTPIEFNDESCFHFEVRQPLFENLISGRLLKQAIGAVGEELNKARAAMHSQDSKL